MPKHILQTTFPPEQEKLKDFLFTVSKKSEPVYRVSADNELYSWLTPDEKEVFYSILEEISDGDELEFERLVVAQDALFYLAKKLVKEETLTEDELFFGFVEISIGS